MEKIMELLNSQGFAVAIAVVIIITFIQMYKKINEKYIDLVEKNQKSILEFSQTTKDFSEVLEKYSNIIIDIQSINKDITDIKKDVAEIKEDIKKNDNN